jgi:hypothetical protein
MLGRHARPFESFLVCIEDSALCFLWSFACLFLVLLFLVWFPGFEWVSPRISLRERCMHALCTFVIDLVPSNAGKPLRFKDFQSEL